MRRREAVRKEDKNSRKKTKRQKYGEGVGRREVDQFNARDRRERTRVRQKEESKKRLLR